MVSQDGLESGRSNKSIAPSGSQSSFKSGVTSRRTSGVNISPIKSRSFAQARNDSNGGDEPAMVLSKFRSMKGPNHPFPSIDHLHNIEPGPNEWRNVPLPLVEFSDCVLACMSEIKRQIHECYNDASKLNRGLCLTDRNSRREDETIRKDLMDEVISCDIKREK